MGDLYLKGLGVEQNSVEAEKLFRKAAENGNAAAQSFLAMMYEEGIPPLEQNDQLSDMWYERAAAKGDLDAINAVAVKFEESGDLETATSWYLKAAQKGVVESQYNLGDLYQQQKNITKALYWYREAALQGDEDSKTEFEKLLSEHQRLKKYQIDCSNVLSIRNNNNNQFAAPIHYFLRRLGLVKYWSKSILPNKVT